MRLTEEQKAFWDAVCSWEGPKRMPGIPGVVAGRFGTIWLTGVEDIVLSDPVLDHRDATELYGRMIRVAEIAEHRWQTGAIPDFEMPTRACDQCDGTGHYTEVVCPTCHGTGNCSCCGRTCETCHGQVMASLTGDAAKAADPESECWECHGSGRADDGQAGVRFAEGHPWMIAAGLARKLKGLSGWQWAATDGSTCLYLRAPGAALWCPACA